MIKITAELPRSITIGGAAYAINTDFRIMTDFEKKISDADASDRSAFARILSETAAALFKEVPKANADQIIEGLLWYYRCGRELPRSSCGGGKRVRCYDYDEDADYIYAAFLQQYGDDLINSHMHWWEFRAKFISLTDAAVLVRIMQYRAIDASGIRSAEERSRIRRIQERFALTSSKSRRFASLKARDDAFRDKLRRRYEEVRRQAEGKEKE